MKQSAHCAREVFWTKRRTRHLVQFTANHPADHRKRCSCTCREKLNPALHHRCPPDVGVVLLTTEVLRMRLQFLGEQALSWSVSTKAWRLQMSPGAWKTLKAAPQPSRHCSTLPERLDDAQGGGLAAQTQRYHIKYNIYIYIYILYIYIYIYIFYIYIIYIYIYI